MAKTLEEFKELWAKTHEIHGIDDQELLHRRALKSFNEHRELSRTAVRGPSSSPTIVQVDMKPVADGLTDVKALLVTMLEDNAKERKRVAEVEAARVHFTSEVSASPSPVVTTVVDFVPVTRLLGKLVSTCKAIGIAGLILLALLVLLSIRGHAQFSHVDYIKFQNAGTDVTGGFFSYPFKINLVGITGTAISGGITLTAAGGGSGCVPTGGAGDLLYDTGLTTCASSSDFVITSHTLAGGSSAILDLHAMSPTAGLRLPGAAGAAPTADEFISVNTTNHTLGWGSNGTTIVGAAAATGTNSATTCTNQVITAVSGVAVPTCSSVSNAMLSNPATTVNGATCTLGSTCNVNGSNTANTVALNEGAGMAIGATSADSTTTHALFATAGAPAFRAIVAGDLPGTGSTTVNGQTCTLGSTCAVESATAGQLAVSGGSGSALTGWADFTVSSHTGTLGASGVVDLSAGSVTLPGGTVVGGTVGIISFTEGACSGAVSGSDVLCADATLHAFKSSLNNGSFVAIPQLAGDLGGTAASPQVTGGTHITGVPLAGLASEAANTIVGNVTGSPASPTAAAAPAGGTSGCAGSTDAVIYTAGTGWGCHQITGTGTVTSSGPPSQYQIPVFTTATNIAGITPSATSGVPLVSQGATSNPAFGTAVIAGGGTGQVTQQAAFDALAPTATVAGSIAYWNGTHWVKLDGNASGTHWLQEDSGGAPSWTTPSGSGTVNAGTATHLAYYATSTTAVSDAGADLVFDGTHTYSAATTLVFNLSAATGTAAFIVPGKAGDTATAAGVIDFDSTGNNYHVFANGADAILVPVASAPTNLHCAQFSVSGSNILLSDAGGACTTGGSGDTITSPNSTLTVGGTTSNTTLDVVGAAGKILAGSTPALTYTPALGVDASSAGTLTLSNGAGGGAHTIWASGATTTNTVAGPATVPTTGHILDCSTSSTTCTLHDSGLVTANEVNASSPGAGIAHFAGSTQTVTSSAVALTDMAAQAADTIVQNATGGSAAPTAVAMPACTTGADLYNTSTHAWSCVATGGTTPVVGGIVGGTSVSGLTSAGHSAWFSHFTASGAQYMALPANLSFDKFMVVTTTNNAVGNFWNLGIEYDYNTTATAHPLFFSIAPGQASGTIGPGLGTYTFPGGEPIDFNFRTVGGGSAAAIHGVAMEITGANVAILGQSGNGGTVAGSTTVYSGPGQDDGYFAETTESKMTVVMPYDATLGPFCTFMITAQPSAGALTFTLDKNASGTTSTFAVPSSGAIGSYCDYTHTVSFVAGDRVSWSIANANASTSGQIGVTTVLVTPAGAGPTGMFTVGMDQAAPFTGGAFYAMFAGGTIVSATSNLVATPMPRAVTFKNMHCYGLTAPTVNSSVWTLAVNGTGSALTVPMTTGGSYPGDFSDTSHTVAVNAGDLVDLTFTQASGNQAGLSACSLEYD